VSPEDKDKWAAVLVIGFFGMGLPIGLWLLFEWMAGK